RPAADTRCRARRDQAPRAFARHLATRLSAFDAAFLRLAPAGIVGQSARGAGAAGPRRHRHDANLHAPRFPAPRQGLRRRAPAREAEVTLSPLPLGEVPEWRVRVRGYCNVESRNKLVMRGVSEPSSGAARHLLPGGEGKILRSRHVTKPFEPWAKDRQHRLELL